MAGDVWTEFSTERERTARKAHRCGECWRVIQVGERYVGAAGKSEGDFWSAKQCAHCHAATQWLAIVCRGWLYGGVWEDLEDHRWEPRPIWSLDLGRLIVWYRRGFRNPDGSLVDPLVLRDIAERGARRTMRLLEPPVAA